VEGPRDLEGAADAEIDDAVRRQSGQLAAFEADRARVGVKAPASMLKIVDLPEPLGPIRPTISPGWTANETSLTAVKPPNRFVSPATLSTRSRHWAASAFYRLLIPAIVLLPTWFFDRDKTRMDARSLAIIAIGGLFFALDLAFYNTSILLTSAANATILGNNTPIFVGC